VVVTVYRRIEISECDHDTNIKAIPTLASTRHGEHDLGRMPGTDTSNLAKTLVGLAGKLLGAPTVGDTLEAVALGDGDNINDLVLLENGGDLDRLLKQAVRKVDLVWDGATVNLDLHQVRLLLRDAGLADLSVRKHTDDGAVLADALELAGHGLAAILGRLLRVAGEGLLLRAIPVLVEPALDLVGEVRCPDGGEGAETARSLNVADDTNDDQRRGLNDSNRLHYLTLVHLCE
jgi:hypothetical protein